MSHRSAPPAIRERLQGLSCCECRRPATHIEFRAVRSVAGLARPMSAFPGQGGNVLEIMYRALPVCEGHFHDRRAVRIDALIVSWSEQMERLGSTEWRGDQALLELVASW